MPRLKKKSDDIKKKEKKIQMMRSRLATDESQTQTTDKSQDQTTEPIQVISNCKNIQTNPQVSVPMQDEHHETHDTSTTFNLFQSNLSAKSDKESTKLMSQLDSYFDFQIKQTELKHKIEEQKPRTDYWRSYKIKKRLNVKYKLQETENRRLKRMNPDYIKKQNQRETPSRQAKRLDDMYRENQNQKETPSRKTKRVDEDYKMNDNFKHVSYIKRKRLNLDYTEKQNQKETPARKTKRVDEIYRKNQNQKETPARKTKRVDKAYKLNDNLKHVSYIKRKRLDESYRLNQNKKETLSRRRKRLNPAYQKKQNVLESSKRKLKRLNSFYRLQQCKRDSKQKKTKRCNVIYRLKARHQSRKSKKKKRKERKNLSTREMINQFHENIQNGPTYMCESCQQLWFKHSVKKSVKLKSINDSATNCLIQNGYGWICGTCEKYIKKDRIPPLSIYNGNAFPELPEDFQDLHPLEWRLLSPRIPFMKIYAAPRGKQKKIRGNVVNVPANVSNTVFSLPRTTDENHTIAANLKRQLKYNHAVMTENIRPYKIREAALWLQENGDLYQKEGIVFHENLTVESVPSEDEISEFQSDQQNLETKLLAESDQSLANQSDQLNKKQLDQSELQHDDWSEDESDEVSGSKDTLLTSTDFIESNEKEKIHSFAPAQGNIPMSLFMDKHSEELAFPDIFCGKSRTKSDSRQSKVYYSELCKSELRRHDRRAAKNIDNIFFKLKKSQMKTMIGQAQIAIRKNKTGDTKLKAGDLKTPGNIQKLIQYDEGYMVLKTLRGSPPYFKKAKTDLFAMIRQLGPATYFGSFSAAETKWKHLLKILGKVQDKQEYSDEDINNMDWETKCRLISSDPVTCVRQFDYQVNLLFNDILKKDHSPLGKVTDFFYRVEFQHRGSPHIHTLLWVDNSPIYACNSNNEITKFIDQTISCKRIVNDEELQTLVNYQIHTHSHTCRKKHQKICRFGFPKPPMPKTIILEPFNEMVSDSDKKQHSNNYDKIKTILDEMREGEDISFAEFLDKVSLTHDEYILAVQSSIRSATVFLQRTPNELRVNSYNPQLLKIWQANLDIQFVLDVYACAMYIASYIAKSQRGISDLLRQAISEVRNGNYGIRDQVKIIGNKFLNNVEISAQEAVYILLQLPMRKASREVVFINTSPPNERVRLLKTQEELDDLADDDNNIQSSNIIERYKNRPQKLDSITLADYAAWYDRKKSYKKRSKIVQNDEMLKENQDEHNSDQDEEESHSNFKRRSIPRVIRYVNFSVDKEPDKHYRELLMLYTNWRDEETDLLSGFDSFQQRYDNIQNQIQTQLSQYDSNKEAVDLAMAADGQDFDETWDEQAPITQQIEREDEEQESIIIENESKKGQPAKFEYDIGSDLGLPSQNHLDDVALFQMPENEYLALMQSLNNKQLHFVYDTLHMIKCSKHQVFRYLSGGAGVGKSFVTTALYQSLLRYFATKAGDDYQTIKQILLAPTGKAAYNIMGNTIHSALMIPVCQSLQYKALDSSRLNTLRTKLGGLKVVFIDEISMVGNGMFNFINKRLQDIKGTPNLFGGCHVICVGDLFQLKPVFDGYIFENLDNEYGPLASNLWQDNFKMFELTQIMRQKDSKLFAELLNRFREGNYTSDEEKLNDINTLKTRLIDSNSGEEYPYHIQHLFLSNEKMNNFNNQVFQAMNGEKFIIKAKDGIVGSAAQAVAKTLLDNVPTDSRKTMQLQTNLCLVVGMKCEISINARIDDGLINGSSCTIKHVQMSPTGYANGSVVWVSFQDINVGKSTRNDHKNLYQSNIGPTWTPILPLSRQFRVGKYKNAEVMRTQIPLRPSAAKTVHRSQGDTLDEVCIDFEGRKTPHIHYVGLSRVKTLEGLHLIHLNEDKISINNDVKKEMQALRNERKLNLQTQDITAITDRFLLVYHNTRSLQKYINHVRTNQTLLQASVIILSETRLKSTVNSDAYNIPGFTLYRNDAYTEKQKPHHGIAIYINNQKVDPQNIVVQACNYYQVEMSLITLNLDINEQSKKCHILGIYKPPKISEANLCLALEKVQNSISDNEHMVVIGDFNLNPQTASKLSQTFKSMTQTITEPTTDSNSLIDLIYTTIPDDYILSGVQENYYSDHKIIYMFISNDKYPKQNVENTCNIQTAVQNEQNKDNENTRTPEPFAPFQNMKQEQSVNAVAIHPSNDILVRKYGYQLTRADLATLNPKAWLNDNIINYYMKYLQNRETNIGNDILTLDVFCYHRINSNMSNAVSFYEGRDIFNHEIIIIPIHSNEHWSLISVFMPSQTIKYYDSITHDERSTIIFEQILRFISQIQKISMRKWKTIYENNITLQNNGYDCGVHLCRNADMILQKQSLKTTQREITIYRNKIKQIILMQ